MAGIATAVFAAPEVMVAGERGLAVLHHGAMHLLKSPQADALRNISGMAVTPDGDRWFNGVHGVVHVRAADWQRTMADPQAPLAFTVLDARDGYPGQAATLNRLPSVVQGSAGELWFAATGGVVRLATRTLQANPVAPDAQIRHVSTAQAAYPATPTATRAMQLPPASNDIGIAFTAPALRRPEDIRFAWRLEGVDRGWVGGASRRTASYTGLAPGHYRFHVRAINEDGVSGGAEATQAIDIAPTLIQTTWFKGMCALLLVLLGVALYRYRIGVLTARLSVQMQVRASERERIARTLHDTYLQSVHALLLRIGAMAQSMPNGSPTRVRLETVLADASSAVIEGRGQLEQLRTGSPGALAYALEDTIENVLARAAGPLRQCYPETAYEMQVTGTRRPLAPAVLDEAGQIAAEALRNAFMHAGACRIAVLLDYGPDFIVQVRDDGRGLDADILAAGYRSGHWGLLGMRERAANIRAQLDLYSAPGAGATVRLTVAGASAYLRTEPARPWLRRSMDWLASR
jgi:signal transduction histidine kinase